MKNTNYVKCKTGGLQCDPPEFMGFCHVTLHLWGRVFKMFPDLRGLVFVDADNIKGRFSQVLRLIEESKPIFKHDGNLDFNLGKTMFLTKGRVPYIDKFSPHRARKLENLKFSPIGLNVLTQTFRTLRMILLFMCSVQGIDSHRRRHLHQGIRDE